MVLLKSVDNRDLGNMSFEEKRVESAYDPTKQVAKKKRWTLDEIRQRQAKLAKLAVATWPID